ncbi:N-acetylmuramoyl-L-alanine amidase [Thalassospira marina]|uniref:N-acetylmuramoyl-L-alanine amidase n=1 Tax=Thalassospira marina TaxID=2048283 RepID=A0A2N3KWG6_9PROT|nr:N-acetylmuramoyl-L-alanine amidase [Thalassospira marina]
MPGQQGPNAQPIIWQPSPNFGDRPADCAIDMLVLHYTGMPSGEAALARMCDPASQVSAHYMVEEDGCIYQLVTEAKRAWHAGRGQWRGCTDVNSRSIGIEIVNPGHEFGYRPFAVRQMDAVIALCKAILGRHTIPAHNIIAHSDMAPERKEDPGELFPWEQFAVEGIGLWPRIDASDHSPQNTAEIITPENGFSGSQSPYHDDKVASAIAAEKQTSRQNAAALMDGIAVDAANGNDNTQNGSEDCEALFDRLLLQFGYGPGDPVYNRIAFQRHWRPHRLDGRADAQSIAILKDLIDQCPPLS